jgi:hypothetical protein
VREGQIAVARLRNEPGLLCIMTVNRQYSQFRHTNLVNVGTINFLNTSDGHECRMQKAYTQHGLLKQVREHLKARARYL